jgi:hypothetical protein
LERERRTHLALFARRKLLAASAAAAASLVVLASTTGATQLAVDTPVLDMKGRGLAIAEAGVGLQGLGSGTRTVTIDIGGPVEKAILYWAGRDLTNCVSGACFQAPNTPPFADQELVFAGGAITGAIVGMEGADSGNIGYAADVTSVVQGAGTGTQSFTIADGNLAKNLDRLNGAGLIVVYTDASDANSYEVTIADGLDFAYAGLGSPNLFIPENRITSPATFSFAPSDSARTAQLTLFVGDSEPGRADRVDVSNNSSILNSLDGSDGPEFDTDTHTITIPASAGQTSVQLFSAPPAPARQPQPDSLLWVLAALRVPVTPGQHACTPGYWKNHLSAWTATGLSPTALVGNTFTIPANLSTLGGETLREALAGGGGPGVLGAARILLRAGVAAMLNAGHPSVDYPSTRFQVRDAINAALASNNRSTMLARAAALDADNNLGCPLN